MVLLAAPDRHLNHSCDPNSWKRYRSLEAELIARRAIVAGEELTVDYNISITGGSSWPCRCRAARCLGSTTGDYFLLPLDRQLEYLPLLASWFVENHRERVAKLRSLVK